MSGKESEPAWSLLDQEGPELLCGGCLWDPKHDYEQLEALCNARRSTCELKFEKVTNLVVFVDSN